MEGIVKMVTISLDLETWGKRPGCDIRSIGACVFDPATGQVVQPCQYCRDGRYTGLPGNTCENCMNTGVTDGYGDTFYIACDNPFVALPVGWVATDPNSDFYRKYPLTRDPDTVKWWSEQSDDAQAAFADPVDLAVALERFRSWIAHIGDPRTLRIYAHGPQFDCSILEAAYHAVGLPVPWHYRAPRDTRTVFDLCGITDHSAWLDQYATGTVHHALDDAICQARAVCAAMARLCEWPEYDTDIVDAADQYSRECSDAIGRFSITSRMSATFRWYELWDRIGAVIKARKAQ